MTGKQERATVGGTLPTMETTLGRDAGGGVAYAQLIVLGVAVLFAAATVGLLLLRSDPRPATANVPLGAPTLVSRGQLEQIAQRLDHPVYWAGPRAGFSYELTATAGGRVFVRYLPSGVTAGDPRPSFLAIGTYPARGSFTKLQQAAKQPGTTRAELGKGAIAVYAPKRSTSVYVGYPGADYQIEVYAPSGSDARRLVLNGLIKPIR
jgi:hypothetical protein